MSQHDGMELPHVFKIWIPVNCCCNTELPRDFRTSVLQEVKRTLSRWFGGFNQYHLDSSGYAYEDGTLEEAPCDILEAFADDDRFNEHHEDFLRLAVTVAEQLTQERVMTSVDGKPTMYPPTFRVSSKNCAHSSARVFDPSVFTAAPKKLPPTLPLRPLDKLRAISDALRTFKSATHARDLFCKILNYAHSDGIWPVGKWPKGLREALQADPEILADQNGFKIMHLHLAAERLRRTDERAVIQRIFKDDPSFHGLFIVSNQPQDRWEFVNARSHGEDAARLVLRRIQVGVAEVRTATERIATVEISVAEEKTVTAAEIQQRHDKAFDVEAVTREFYREVADWYFWALQHPKVKYPRGVRGEQQKSVFLIRLLTRLIFCWFLQAKGLVPRELFLRKRAKELLKDFAPNAGTFYRAILQNLFFATLNQEQGKRGFRKKYEGSRDGNRGVTTLYRYEDLLEDPKELLELLKQVPFVNGGLFDCLDEVYTGKEGKPDVRLDDFSEEKENRLCVPNELFFGELQEVDLSEAYGDTKHRQEKVRGLIEILNRYHFTVEESTPLDQEIALDPEMLGKVFENLLASYNEETKTTARKATGAFYTPREIVSYMVDESLLAHLETALEGRQPVAKNAEARLRRLFAYDNEAHEFDPAEVDALVEAVDRVKIIDPACGSGAFPMGILHKLVFILAKLDPGNERWKARQIAKAKEIPDATSREAAIAAIEQAFGKNELDYGRKLYLIENCIYGVDIQPIAVQISKLRFFISLLVDQKVDEKAGNRGVIPLPNLETKFVAANTLIDLKRPGQQLLRNQEIDKKEEQLRRVRERFFSARTPAAKAQCRKDDAKLRAEIADLLKDDGWDTTTARRLAAWDPYDQNASAEFFDSEWMFGLTSGFDVAIGNPPYIRIQTLNETAPDQVRYFKDRYHSASHGNYDLSVVFVERGLELLHSHGQLAYILPHKFFNNAYGLPLRRLLAQGKHLRHVVHFGDQQVFVGATNYVCLLFLSRAGTGSCRFARAHDLAAWLACGTAIETTIPATRVNAKEWNFAAGKGVGLLEKLQTMPITLGDLAASVAQGIRTSANDVYVLDVVHEKGGMITARSKRLDREVEIERKAVLRFLRGRDIKAYSVKPSGKVVLMPYTLNGHDMNLIAPRQLRTSWPKAWAYLQANKEYLAAREGGKMNHEGWYGFVYPKNLDVMFAPKVLVPDIADRAALAFDQEGEYAFTSGYGITFKPEVRLSPKYVLAILNSRLLDYYWKHLSTPIRGGFFRYFAQYLEPLPVLVLDLSVEPQRAEHDALVHLVERIIKAKEGELVAEARAMEQEIDDRVYRLYGLTRDEIAVVEAGE